MIERRPPPAALRSLESVQRGAQLFPHFHEHIDLRGPITAAHVAAIAQATGLKERQIRTLAQRYKTNPAPEAFASGPRGPKPGTHRISPELLEIIDQLADDIFLQRVPPSRAEAARQIWGLLAADNGDYRYAESDLPGEHTIERLIAEGEYCSDGFLDLVQMDHTKGDGILVDSVAREELGRPWITLLIEIWTRCILGFYVSFGDPSIFRCGRAVANALLPKEPLLDELGVTIDYPMYGGFKRLHADQAKPHRNVGFRTACARNGIDPDIRQAGPAHMGGHIERLIGTMIGKLRLLPGSTGSNVGQRDGYDAGAEAVMTLKDFERWFLYQIAIYHNHPHDGLGGLCPAQVWESEAAKRGPLLSNGVDPDQLFRQFLPSKALTVQSKGVVILHRHYWHKELANRIGQKIWVAEDELSIQRAYAELDGRFVEMPITGHYPEVSKWEWEDARKRVRALGASYQQGGARAATSRAIVLARREVEAARACTKETRRRRKLREPEGLAQADLRRQQVDPEPAPAVWKPVAELGEDTWLRTGL